MNEMSVNHRIEYVPLTKDLNGNNLLYPIYIPINVDEPEIFAATGRLSKHDYKRTLKILHSKPMLISAGKPGGNDVEVQEAGFPFAPLIAALAPIVIPGAINAVKSLFKKKSKGRLNLGRGDDEEESDEEVEEITSEEEEEEESSEKQSGYIPTNPNIKTLKQLQKIYSSHV